MAAKAQPAKANARRHVAHPTVIGNQKNKITHRDIKI